MEGLDRNSGSETRSVSEEDAVVRCVPRLRFGLRCYSPRKVNK